jgi:hypothetical protein
VRFALAALVAASVLASSGPVRAGGTDFRLNGVDRNGQGILFSCEPLPCAADDAAFASFATELSFLLSPRLASPAATLGVAGFEVGLLWSGHFVSDEDHWLLTEDGQDTGEAASFLQTMQLEVRKGLPLSFEVAATLSWLVDSQVFAPGLELKWAFQEGYDYLPDLALRGAVNTMVGSPDMSLTNITADFVLSKSVAAGGVARITPYASFGALFTSASSEVVDPTPTTFVEQGDPPVRVPDSENDIAFDAVGLTEEVFAKVTAGVRARFSLIDVLVQGELMMFRDGEVIGPAGTVTTKLSLVF